MKVIVKIQAKQPGQLLQKVNLLKIIDHIDSIKINKSSINSHLR